MIQDPKVTIRESAARWFKCADQAAHRFSGPHEICVHCGAKKDDTPAMGLIRAMLSGLKKEMPK